MESHERQRNGESVVIREAIEAQPIFASLRVSQRERARSARVVPICKHAEKILSVATFFTDIRACITVHSAPDCTGPENFSAVATQCSAVGDRRPERPVRNGAGPEDFSIVRLAIPAVAAQERIGAEHFQMIAAAFRNGAIAILANEVALRGIGAAWRTIAAPRRTAAEWVRAVAVRVAIIRARGRDIRVCSRASRVLAVRDLPRNRAKYAVRATGPDRGARLAPR